MAEMGAPLGTRATPNAARIFPQQDGHPRLALYIRQLDRREAHPDLLSLCRDDTRQSAEVKRLAQGHIDALEQKIRGLQDMAHTLTMLANACQGDHRPRCPILQGLETDPEDEDLSIQPRPGAVARLS